MRKRRREYKAEKMLSILMWAPLVFLPSINPPSPHPHPHSPPLLIYLSTYRYRSRSAFISGSNTRVNGVFFYDRPIYWKIPPSFFFFFFSFFCCCVTSNGTPHTNSHKIVLDRKRKENDWRKRCYQVVGWAHLLKRRRRRRKNESNRWERLAK